MKFEPVGRQGFNVILFSDQVYTGNHLAKKERHVDESVA
jgi:hypothetical protein